MGGGYIVCWAEYKYIYNFYTGTEWKRSLAGGYK